ncbi:MAG: heterodisulfide reductase-related iron-sulfur binding cluster [Marinilabiliales bacterium]|nr:heterodisulfide reductase-related iron-sulfur binding cluster [Marinilabiliales bacterium]
MDEQGGVCCGRPLMLAGRDKEARELINHNSDIIWKSGAKILVTSCPICYKVFRESYYLEATGNAPFGIHQPPDRGGFTPAGLPAQEGCISRPLRAGSRLGSL